jgi:nitrate/nitrite transport system permease protein
MLIGGVGIGFFIWDAWNSSRISDIIVALALRRRRRLRARPLVALVGHIVTRGTAAT